MYVLDLAERSKGTYLRLLRVRLVVAAGFNFTFTFSRDFII